VLYTFRSPFYATIQKNVYVKDNCQIDILQKMNVSSCETSKALEYDNTSDKSVCSCHVRSEVRNEDVSELHVGSQARPGAGSGGVMPILYCAKNMDHLLTDLPGDDAVSKTGRKQPISPVLTSHLENELCLGAQENKSESVSQGSAKLHVTGGRTSRNSASVAVDFQERKRIVKRKQSLDMFGAEEALHSDASSPKIKATKERKLHKTNSNCVNSTEKPETNSCEGSKNLKTSSLVSGSDSVNNRNMEEVEQNTDGWCNFSDWEELEEGVLSYYNDTMPYSQTVSTQFQKFVMTPSLPANNSSTLEKDLEYASFKHVERNTSGNIAETHVDVINHASLIKHLPRKGSHFRTVATNQKNCRLYAPRINPPSKNEILATLSEFCIPEYRHQEPFFGSVLDTGSKKEVGSSVLTITSLRDLQPFAGSLPDILDIDAWRRKWLQEFSCAHQGSLDSNSDLGLDNMKPALASHRDVVVTPCKVPPSVTEVKLWFLATQHSTGDKLKEDQVGDKVSSKKIMMPLSPGQESVSDVMSISPVTPGSLSFEQDERGNATAAHSTPQVTLAPNDVASPSYTPIRNCRQNRANMLLKRSRKGFKFNSQNQENVSFTLPLIREELEEAKVDTILEHGAASQNPVSSDSSKLLHFYDTGGPYKHEVREGRSEGTRAVEGVDPVNAVGLISSTQVFGK
jgi:hypothetical protein